MNRALDILLATIAMVALIPFLLPVVIILRLTGEGEIFYVQNRVGRFNQEFGLVKFATMLKDSPTMPGGTITRKGDPRVLPFGGILRKTKLNELPQLYNVLAGHMSIIGPRPLTTETFACYEIEIAKKVASVRPGLSGVGSIAFRDEESLIVSEGQAQHFYSQRIAPVKGQLESWYVDNKSMKVDVLLILITVWVVLSPRSDLLWRIFPSLPKLPSNIVKEEL